EFLGIARLGKDSTDDPRCPLGSAISLVSPVCRRPGVDFRLDAHVVLVGERFRRAIVVKLVQRPKLADARSRAKRTRWAPESLGFRLQLLDEHRVPPALTSFC